MIDSEPLPWVDYEAEFRESLPEAIQELMEEVASGANASDHSSSIRERLKAVLDLFKVSRYRPLTSGDLLIEEPRTRGGRPNSLGQSHSSTGRSRTGTIGGAAGGVYSVFLKKDGLSGQAVRADIFPTTKWVSVKDGTREVGDMEDRAARFLLDQNVLFINADFRVFIDMVDYWTKQIGQKAGVQDVITDAVRAWFEQALVETVIGIQALKDSKEWTPEDIDKALSEQALTATVMQRYHVNNAVKRELGSKLGRLASQAEG